MAQPEIPPPTPVVALQVNDSERRWFHTLLVVTTVAVTLLLIGQISTILVYFSDILLLFFLSWLLAFVLSPLVTGIIRAVPTLPRGLVTILTYLVIMLVLTILVLFVAQSLATSIAQFVESLPTIQERLPEILAPWQSRIDSLGLHVDLVQAARDLLGNLGNLGGNLVKPLTDLAVGILGIFGNFLLIVFLSLFMVADKDRLVAFFNRLVPPRYSEDMRVFETSVVSSFGGFIRGQAIQGVIYGTIAAVTHVVFGIDYMPASAALSGLLQTIPFFGPFFSWAPPVISAALSDKPQNVIPALIVMGIGWFIVMNIVQPRVMASAVGIHPIAVLGSVLIGLKLAGIAGAIFGLPIAAVISSFFFHYLNRTNGGPRDVAHRAARRIEQREGRPVRVPTAPGLGTESAAAAATEAHEQMVHADPLADALEPPEYTQRSVPPLTPRAAKDEASEPAS
jgi:predicted PurR-regulated permease PerM